MHRFFVEPDHGPERAYLLPEEAGHALRVLRLTRGAAVEALDGRDRYAGVLEEAEDGRLPVRLMERLPDQEARLRVTLYQGLAKGDKMDYIVQKATEIGVAAIVPVELSRCVSRPDGKSAAKAQVRWQRIAREAAKQCGRAWVPEVSLPISLKALQERAAGHGRLLIPWEEARGVDLRAGLSGAASGDVGLLIGPEGGLAGDEVQSLLPLGAVAVTLGPRILRTETAGLCALALLLLPGGVGDEEDI